MKIKLCGFTNKETADAAIKAGADFIGFVFAKNSPRNIDPKKAGAIAADFPGEVKKVAVICDASDEELSQIISNLKPDFLQLHGDEDLKRVKEIKNKFGVKIIKAFKVENHADLAKVQDFEEVADFLMFDAKNPGSGKSFDWKILSNLKTTKPYFLSGGLNISNIDQALEITNAKMIDLSSGIEEVRGVKSIRLIEELMKKLNERYGTIK